MCMYMYNLAHVYFREDGGNMKGESIYVRETDVVIFFISVHVHVGVLAEQ